MTNKVQYVSGDLFIPVKDSTEFSVIAHVVNNKGMWGSGFVVPLGKEYPASKDSYLAWAEGKAPPNEAIWNPKDFEFGQVQFVQVCDMPLVLVANMLAQTIGGVRPLGYHHLVKCMEEVGKYIVRLRDRHKVEVNIRCPLFGAGLAGGQWAFIEKLIEDCWLNRDIPVYAYYLPKFLPVDFDPSDYDPSLKSPPVDLPAIATEPPVDLPPIKSAKANDAITLEYEGPRDPSKTGE